MASDDEDDLASLRAMAKVRQESSVGAAGFNQRALQSLREKQLKEREKLAEAASFFQNVPPIGLPAPPPSTIADNNQEEDDQEDDDEEDDPVPPEAPMVDDEANFHEGLRAHLPLTFGKQEAKPSQTLESIHLSTKRAPSAQVGDAPRLSSSRGLVVGPMRERQVAQGERRAVAFGPPRPPRGEDDEVGEEEEVREEVREESSSGGEEDEEEEGEEDEYRLPLSNEVVLGGHSKVAAALAVDPTGARVLTGSYDYTVRMFDFAGMNSKLASFRQVEPSEGHQVRALSWSPTADQFLVCTGSAQAKVYDRDGATLGEFIKGDMYIRDLRHTKGHIMGIKGGEWHPKERNTVLTCSEDGTLRIWDVTNFKGSKQVIKPKLAKPGRVSVTCCAWGPDGKSIAGGLYDGSLQIWGIKPGWGTRPDLFVPNAHENQEEITGISFSADGNMVLSRSTDSTLKVWDVRRFKSPLKEFDDLPNLYSETNAVFSPDELLFCTGTSKVPGGSESGSSIVFFEKERLELVRRAGVSDTQSVVRIAWHPRLNQIFATTGDKKVGATHIFYDPALSERGVLMCVARAPRKPRMEDFQLLRPVIYNPHALPLFREEPSRKRSREKARKDPIKSKRPELPVAGPGHHGRIGQTKGSLLTQYLLREGGLIKETWMEEDPREAILKHAEAAKKEPAVFGEAYAATQPKPIFAEPDSDEEDEK